MGFGLINPFVAKILLAAEDGDSVNRISQRIGASYSYTYEWIEQLEEIGILDRDDGVHIQDKELAEQYRSLAAAVLKRDTDLEDAYLLPNFSGMEYRFSSTDAVFIWTKGGYQIGRNQRDYPIFIDIHEEDIAQWKRFFTEFGQEFSLEDRIEEGEPGIYYVLNPQESGFESDLVENSRVMPLEETVEWMQAYEVNFQPALEMVDSMYDLDLGATYREREAL